VRSPILIPALMAQASTMLAGAFSLTDWTRTASRYGTLSALRSPRTSFLAIRTRPPGHPPWLSGILPPATCLPTLSIIALSSTPRYVVTGQVAVTSMATPVAQVHAPMRCQRLQTLRMPIGKSNPFQFIPLAEELCYYIVLCGKVGTCINKPKNENLTEYSTDCLWSGIKFIRKLRGIFYYGLRVRIWAGVGYRTKLVLGGTGSRAHLWSLPGSPTIHGMHDHFVFLIFELCLCQFIWKQYNNSSDLFIPRLQYPYLPGGL